MLNYRFLLVVAALLGASSVSAREPAEVDEAVLAAVKKLTLRVTFRQAIGKFASFHGPAAGDTLELDLNALPNERLIATPSRSGSKPYVSLSAPLEFVKVKTSNPPANPRRTLIRLAAENRDSHCRIVIVADGLESGDKVRLVLYTNDGFLGSMAEAEGEWK